MRSSAQSPRWAWSCSFAGFAVRAGVAGAAQFDGHLDALCGQLLVLGHLDHDGALHPLAEQLTAVLVHTGDAAGGVVCVGRAAAGAVELGPAVLALRAGVGVAVLELIPHGGVGDALPDVAHPVLGVADELVAGVQVAPGGHGHVLGAGAAARNALVDAGAAGQVDHVMVEGKAAALAVALDHFLGQDLILLLQDGQVGLGQGAGVVRLADHRLHAQLSETEVCHVEDVVGEVGVEVGVGAAHVVALVAALPDELLELGHDGVIAAVARVVLAEAVVDLLAAIEAQDDIVALLVAEVDHILVDQHPVGGHGEAEVLVVDLLLLAAVGHQLLHHLKVHQRLTTEEIDFEVAAGAGVLDEEIHGALAHLKAHQRTVALIAALRGEAVGAVQVAGVGHMQAERLDHGVAVLEVEGHVGVGIGAPQLARLLQRGHILQALAQVGLGHVGAVAVLFEHGRYDRIGGALLVQGDDVIRHIVHHMHRAAAGVQHDVIAVQLILMYHFSLHSIVT